MQDQYKQDNVQRRAVKRIISHPDYNQMTFDYDIALLELSEPLKFSNTIQPICLPSSSHVFPAGMSCSVTGWGALREGGIMHKLMILRRESLLLLLLLLFFTRTAHFEYFSNGWPTLELLFSFFAYPSRIKIKTFHPSPHFHLTISYSSSSFIFSPRLLPFSSPSSFSHFILSSSFALMSLPFLYLSHHDILLFRSTLPPFFFPPLIFF